LKFFLLMVPLVLKSNTPEKDFLGFIFFGLYPNIHMVYLVQAIPNSESFL
jgi:hypothetical protein